jgi:MFS family permease
MVAILSVTETVSWGIVYYSFAVFLAPIAAALAVSTTVVSGALSVALVVSALAGVAVGRYLDHHGPRTLMGAGSLAGVALVVAWSRVDGVLALYAVWVGLGCVIAAVLYEPAFVVLAKWFTLNAERRRAMTAMTLVAALASFIFVPVAQALLDHHGWRDAILILAAILAVTVPLNLMLPAGGPPVASGESGRPSREAVARTVRRGDFRRLTLGYFLASFAGLAPFVLVIPLLTGRGYSSGFAAFALGTIGVSQIPGRLLFAAAGRELGHGLLTAATFGLVGLGLLLMLVAPSAALVLAGTVVLGAGNGMMILTRATLLAERFGTTDYGAVAGLVAAATTAARAVSPVAATAAASLVGIEAVFGGLIACAAAAIASTAGLSDP